VRPPRSLPDRLRAAVRAALDEGWAWVAERQQDSRLP
jgi:hypothetical protein